MVLVETKLNKKKKPSLVEVKRKQNAKLNICFIVAQPAFHKFMI